MKRVQSWFIAAIFLNASCHSEKSGFDKSIAITDGSIIDMADGQISEDMTSIFAAATLELKDR